MSKALLKENFNELAEKAAKDRVKVKRLQRAEEILSYAIDTFIKACADLGIDTEDELRSLDSIDAVLERYSSFSHEIE
jgi:hypothetical protein